MWVVYMCSMLQRPCAITWQWVCENLSVQVRSLYRIYAIIELICSIIKHIWMAISKPWKQHQTIMCMKNACPIYVGCCSYMWDVVHMCVILPPVRALYWTVIHIEFRRSFHTIFPVRLKHEWFQTTLQCFVFMYTS